MPTHEVMSIETRTQRQMLALILQNGKSSYLLNLIASAALALAARSQWQGGAIHPFVWLAGVALVNAPTYMLMVPHLKTMAFMDDAGDYRSVERLQYWGTIAMGLGWSTGILLYGFSGSIEFRMFLAVLLAGMGAGAVPKLAGEMRYFGWFLGLLVVPLILIGFANGTLLDNLLTICAFIYVFGVVESARNLNDALRTSTRLSVERLSLLDTTRQALTNAEHASKAKSEFLANMSHEIRNPINSILGVAQVMLRTETNTERAAQLQRIDVATEHLLGVINGILDLSKIEAGKMRLDLDEVDIGETIDRVAMLVARDAANKGLRLRVDAAPLPRRLIGDRVRLTQALLNYANNAVKFTHQGTVTIHVRQETETGQRTMLRFEVEDTGVGIEPTVLGRLFSAFEQGDASATRAYGGSGLGLVITRHLAQMMGGEVGVRSQPGVGSTFWFTAWLDKQDALAESADPGLALDDAETALRHHHAGQRILLADDDVDNRRLAAEIFTPIQIELDMACSGDEVLSMAGQTAYDLVLMDMRMPRMDGLEATRQLRRLQAYRETPILALTGNAFREDRERCLEAGMNDFIPKPVRLEVLYTKLLEWLPRAG